MREISTYINIIKNLIAMYYEKDMLFYSDGEWYSRYHGRTITLEELEKWVEDTIGHVIFIVNEGEVENPDKCDGETNCYDCGIC